MDNQEQLSKIIKSLKELKESLDEDPKSTRTEKAREAVESVMDSEARNFLFEVVYRSCGMNTRQCIDELQYYPSGYPALWDSFSQERVIADIEMGGKAGEKTKFFKVSTLELLKQNESNVLEFKEIPECKTQQNRKNNDVLFPPLKTIAGFLNAEGGTLLIGVDNSGKIVGIEPYLNTMKQGNNDTFEQQIQNCLRDRFEPRPISRVEVSFEKFQEGTICRVDVRRSEKIIHLDGKVYVREGNTTQELKGRDLTDWTQQR